METLLLELAKQGVLAVITAVAIWAVVKKDRQVSALYDRLTEKTETYLQLIVEQNRAVNDTIHTLAETLDLEVETDVAISSTKTDPGLKRPKC